MSNIAGEPVRVGLGNAVGGLDATGGDLVGNSVAGDVPGSDILQFSLFLGLLSDKSGSLLLGGNGGELSMELMVDADDTHLRNEWMLSQVCFLLGGSNMETADLQHPRDDRRRRYPCSR
jgi:hypothetical protein